jgi:pimeloyl-ACP methyl ester carboxylesterase
MPVERRSQVNNVEIAVWEWPGDEPAVFFCHATGFHARCWDQVIAQLPGRHCYAIDARGHGHSSKLAPPYHWRDFGYDAASVVSQLGLSSALGVGHSMGGHAVTLAAALRPDAFSGLLLLDPIIRAKNSYTGPSQRFQFAAKRRNNWSSAEEMFQRFSNRPPFDAWDRGVLRDYCDYALAPNGDRFVLACAPETEASIYENSPQPDSNIYAEITAIQIPVHVVRSAKATDLAHPDSPPAAPDLAASFAHGTDLCLPNHSHFIPMEAPSLVARWIADILASQRAPAL